MNSEHKPHQEHLFGVVRYGLRVHDPTDETRLAANEALARIQEQLQTAEKQRDAYWKNLNDSLRTNGQLKEQYGTLREALTKAPFPSGHDLDYAYWFHNGRRDALDGSNPASEPQASDASQ